MYHRTVVTYPSLSGILQIAQILVCPNILHLLDVRKLMALPFLPATEIAPLFTTIDPLIVEPGLSINHVV
jgi:hypothetical protein